MRKVSDKEREKLSVEIAGLESLDLSQLRARWKLLYEIEAPPHLSRDWLKRAVAYRIQENALGGLKPATRRLLERVCGELLISVENQQFATHTAGTIIERVELKRDGMQITLNLQALLPTEEISDDGAKLKMTRLVPMQMKRRGVETRLVIPGEAVTVPRSDPALLRALARGHQWFVELAAGRAVSTREIAAREGLSDSYVRHTVPWVCLPPGSWKRSARDNSPLACQPSA